MLDRSTVENSAQSLSASEGRVALPRCIGNAATADAMTHFPS